MTDSSGLIDAADIDTSNVVILGVSNPYYDVSKAEGNYMEFGFQYPEEQIHMIEVIKTAVRCQLELTISGPCKKGRDWAHEYFEYYKS